MTQKDLIDTLEYIAACFPAQFVVNERTEAAYATEFGAEDVADMRLALRNFNKHSRSKFPPTVPQIHEQLRIAKKQRVRERLAPALPSPDDTHDPRKVIESVRDKLKALQGEPIPRMDDDDEIVSGSDDQRFVMKSEVMP